MGGLEQFDRCAAELSDGDNSEKSELWSQGSFVFSDIYWWLQNCESVNQDAERDTKYKTGR